MLTEKQTERMLKKLKRFEDILNPLLFKKIAGIDKVMMLETKERLYNIPDDSRCVPFESGSTWGSEEAFGWFKSDFVVPEEYDGKDLFVMPHTEGYESLLWVRYYF